VSDVSGGIYDPKGIDIKKLLKWVEKHKTVVKFPGTKPISNNELLELECDILVPAALENQITEKNAHRVKCRIIAEGANGPVIPKADKILDKKGVFIIPDILCNAGGVTVSYFEWAQDRMGIFWSEEEVNKRLEAVMSKAFQDVLKISLEHRVNMRVAAFMLAIKRVLDVIMLRGVYA